MMAFLLYIVRSGLYLSIFYAFFLLVMRRTTFFRLNRCLLLAGSVFCLLLPLLKIRNGWLYAEAGPLILSVVREAASGRSASAAGLSGTSILFLLYLSGTAGVLLWTTASAFRVHRIVRNGTRTRIDGCAAVITESCRNSFCFGRTIVLGKDDLESNPAIFLHEKMHVQCRHYADIFFFTALSLFFWWNPLLWVTWSELRLLHEYEADERVLSQGIDARQYHLLLVRKAVGNERFILVSGFPHSNLKNRIGMMLRRESPKWIRWTYLAVLPFLAVAAYAFNPTRMQLLVTPAPGYSVLSLDTDDKTLVTPYHLIDVSPTFDGGSVQRFSEWVNRELRYPETAKSAGISGKVTLSFCIGTDGALSDVKVIRSAHPDLDAEALRVLARCPDKWTPAYRDGSPVKVNFVYPVIFQLR